MLPLYPFARPVVEGVFERRYKRFFADCVLDGGEKVVAHTANTGSMKGLLDPGNRVLLTHHVGTARKLAYSLEAIRVGDTWVGCNTALPNDLVEAAIRRGLIAELDGFPVQRREVKYGPDDRSRIDLLLEDGDRRCFVEVKNTTLRDGRAAAFPDAVTERGLKHVEDLAREAKRGARAAIVFVCQRTDCDVFAPAWAIDPDYARALAKAATKGLEVVAIEARVDRDGVHWSRRLAVDLAPPRAAVAKPARAAATTSRARARPRAGARA